MSCNNPMDRRLARSLFAFSDGGLDGDRGGEATLQAMRTLKSGGLRLQRGL